MPSYHCDLLKGQDLDGKEEDNNNDEDREVDILPMEKNQSRHNHIMYHIVKEENQWNTLCKEVATSYFRKSCIREHGQILDFLCLMEVLSKPRYAWWVIA